MTGMADEKTSRFKVTVKARMYHGILYEAMTQLGMNQTKLAKYLGTNLNMIGGIMRLKKVPRFTTKSGKKLKRKLEELTGLAITEIFPNHVFTEEFLGQDKTIQVTKNVPIDLLGNVGMVRQLTLPPDEELMSKEENDRPLELRIKEVLETLTPRERAVVNKKFFEGRKPSQMTKDFGVSSSRLDQIEKKILRKLRGPMRLKLIRGEISLNDPFFQSWLKAEANRPFACLEK